MASLRAPDEANKTFQITASKHGWGFTKSYFMVINTSVQGFLVLMGFTQSMKFIWSTFWIQMSPVQTWEVPTKINFHCTRLLPSTSLSIWVWNLSIYKNKHFPHNISPSSSCFACCSTPSSSVSWIFFCDFDFSSFVCLSFSLELIKSTILLW